MTPKEIREEILYAAQLIECGISKEVLLTIGKGLLVALDLVECTEEELNNLWKEISIIMNVGRDSLIREQRTWKGLTPSQVPCIRTNYSALS